MPADLRRPPFGPPLVFVPDLGHPVLDDADAHHLGRVLRLRPGDALTAADGTGRWRACTFGGHAELQCASEVLVEPVADPPITIAFALTKGDKPELVVQKLTELGVDRVVAFRAARSIVQWDEAKAARNVERWRAVAREAAMQSRRAKLPIIEPVADFADVAARPGAALAAAGGAPPSLAHPVLLIGPEGGWSPGEETTPLARVALGDHVLRAETAAITACSVLAAIRSRLAGDMSHPDAS
jgi:16S rRNA (uracil1498-N3)-methyltransferase